jgi:MerR family transcriptional regulator, light-induced transcriptional regulator
MTSASSPSAWPCARGWRITYLGPNTPLPTVAEMAGEMRPAAVVLAATTGAGFDADRAALRDLAAGAPVWLAGPGASAGLAQDAGAQLLEVDPLGAAERVAAPIRTA